MPFVLRRDESYELVSGFTILNRQVTVLLADLLT